LSKASKKKAGIRQKWGRWDLNPDCLMSAYL
jgi:hypothetical protein